MKRLLALGLGVMTAIGGFVDIGNLVTSGIAGARFGASLTWAILLGTVGMTVYAEMAGRVTAVSGRAIFHAVRERLSMRLAVLNLGASLLLVVLTLSAELGGVGLVLELVSGVNHLIWVPLVAAFLWLLVWRVPFSVVENGLGLLGLTLLVFVAALFALDAPWHEIAHEGLHPSVPHGEGHPTYFFYAISLFGACMVPYQVLFFSSGAGEERWHEKDLGEMRMNSVIGFPLGGILSAAIMVAAIPVLGSRHIDVSHLGQVALPAAVAFGTVGLCIALVGFLAATLAAGAECALSAGYMVSQFFGWPWGKKFRPAQAPEFHLFCLLALVTGCAFVLTTVDPVTLTLLAVVLGAASIPLTYLPILLVANDRSYMRDRVNGVVANGIGVVYLVITVLISVVTIPLTILTKAGQ